MKYHVPDMSCGHCKSSIETALSALDPEAQVSVDLEAKTVDVATSKPDAAVVTALEEIGFPARGL